MHIVLNGNVIILEKRLLLFLKIISITKIIVRIGVEKRRFLNQEAKDKMIKIEDDREFHRIIKEAKTGQLIYFLEEVGLEFKSRYVNRNWK